MQLPAQQCTKHAPNFWRPAVSWIHRFPISKLEIANTIDPCKARILRQYLQTRRLLAAKQLIADTQLTMIQVALSSGFSSLRRFNDAFSRH